MYRNDSGGNHRAGTESATGTGTLTVERIPSTVIRQGDHPEDPVLMGELLEGYLTIVAGNGGTGKTTLAEQIVRHVSSGMRLGSFELPEKPVTSWCWYLEDTKNLSQDRSLRVAPLGSLAEDRLPEGAEGNVTYYQEAGHGIRSLAEELERAAAGDFALPGLVIIDYLHAFLGPMPSGQNVADWERAKLERLRGLAVEYGFHLLVLTHTNKEGKINSSQALTKVPDAVWMIEPADDPEYATLIPTKVRMFAPTQYALCKHANGTWGFDDQHYVSETQATGAAKSVLQVLRSEGPMLGTALTSHGAISYPKNTVQVTMTRLKKAGAIRRVRGHWEIVAGAGDEKLAAPPALCPACKTVLTFDDGSGYHATCDPAAAVPAPRPSPAPPPPEPEPPADPEPEPEPAEEPSFPAFRKLAEAVQASRMKPILRVEKDRRDTVPWTLITDQMTGEPTAREFCREAPEGRLVAVLDRNGSYPSAMSSVPLAPNRLSRTGPLGTDRPKGQAGIYLVNVPEWTDERIPHPLGRTAFLADGPTWITSSHLALLDKLARAGTIPPVDVLDSWTGRGNGSLFKPFYEWAKQIREETAGTEHAGEAKRAISRAMRSLHSEARSPFWRPDWHKALVSEAAVRHWAVAYRAVQKGAELLSIGNVDEVAFLIPEGVESPELWVPEGYTLGTGYGEIKHKTDVLIHRGEPKKPSPLTAEDWNARGTRRGQR